MRHPKVYIRESISACVFRTTDMEGSENQIPNEACVFSILVRRQILLLLAVEAAWSGCLSPGVAMVKAAHTGQADDLGVWRRSVLDPSAGRRVPEARMDALLIVVGDVVAEQAL